MASHRDALQLREITKKLQGAARARPDYCGEVSGSGGVDSRGSRA